MSNTLDWPTGIRRFLPTSGKDGSPETNGDLNTPIPDFTVGGHLIVHTVIARGV
jgi:hypothetical protein